MMEGRYAALLGVERNERPATFLNGCCWMMGFFPRLLSRQLLELIFGCAHLRDEYQEDRDHNLESRRIGDLESLLKMVDFSPHANVSDMN
jgi:hypothetical protein